MPRITQVKPVVIQDDSLTPGSGAGLNTGYFYHPAGSNRLYILEQVNGEKRWVNVGGSQPDENNSVHYYVSSATGDDQNGDGSFANPFRTLPFAYSLIPQSPGGDCTITLIEEGPYTLPAAMQGVIPQGPEGKPLMICGDTPLQSFVGTVTAVGNGYIDFTGASIAENQVRGFMFRCFTGPSTAHFYQIGHNTTSRLYTIGGNPLVAPGDQFEIFDARTVLNVDSDFAINGPGKIGFWRCKIQCHKMTIAQSSVLFDSCVIEPTDKVSAVDGSTIQYMATSQSDDFKVVTAVGTQLGIVGSYIKYSPAVPANAVRTFDGSSGIGYLVSDGGLDTWVAGRWVLTGLDVDLTGAPAGGNFGVIAQNGGYLQMDSGFYYIKCAGATGVGIVVSQGSTASISAGITEITQAGVVGMIVGGGGVLSMDNVSGSAGNGFGVWVRNGGMLMNFGDNTISGTTGDVIVDPEATATSWSNVGFTAFAYRPITRTKRVTVADVNYVAQFDDELIAYTSLTASRIVSLPSPASTGATASSVKYITIKDESNDASTLIIIDAIPTVGALRGPSTIERGSGVLYGYTDGTAWYFDASPYPAP